MAILYVRSTDGNNSDNGSTWALAKQTLVGAANADAAGDTIHVSHVHAESNAASQTMNFAGTAAAPTKIICGNDGAEPPTAVATSAVVETTGSGQIIINGNLYCYGIAFKCGSGANNGSIGTAAASDYQVFENCAFWIVNTGTTSVIAPSEVAGSKNYWINTQIKFGNTAQSITFVANNSTLVWNGGDIASGSSAPLTLFKYGVSTGVVVFVENVDLSGVAMTNISAPPNARSSIVLRNCKLPSSVNLIASAIIQREAYAAIYNCDDGNTNYRLWIERYEGTIRDETTLVRSGGASDGTTTISWKLVTNTVPTYPHTALASDEFVVWNEVAGVSRTVTVEILHDSATNLKNDEIWLEVNYGADSGSPKGALVTDCKASFVAMAADQAASSATWATTGMSNPNKQALSVTFTPQKKGFLLARVMLAKASTTVYVDPKLTVS